MLKTTRKSSLLGFFVALVASSLLVGCATIFSGTSDDVRFESEPSGAKVVIDGVDRGETPTTVTVSRDALNDKKVTLQKEGYQDEVFRLQKEFTTVAVLNLGNFLFWGIDVLTGALFKYRPTQYKQELESESMGSLMPKSESSTAAQNTAEQDYKAFGIEELRHNSSGDMVLPDHEDGVIVHDPDKGVAYVFK